MPRSDPDDGDSEGAGEVLNPTRTRGRRRSQWALMLIGTLVLIVILATIDLTALIETLRGVEPLLFGAACAMLMSTLVVRTWRWRMLLSDLTERVPPYFELLMIFAYATFVGTATPGRVGEFVKAIHLRRYGFGGGAAMANVLTDRMLDVLTLLVIALFAFLLMVIPDFTGKTTVALIVGAALVVVFAGWMMLRSESFDRLWARIAGIDIELLSRPLTLIGDAGRGFRDAIREQSVWTLFGALTLTLASWAIVYAANDLIAASIGLELTFLQIAGISAITSVVAQIPVSVVGIGTREAAMIFILAQYDIPEEQAVALSALFLASILVVAGLSSLSLLSPSARLAREAREDT